MASPKQLYLRKESGHGNWVYRRRWPTDAGTKTALAEMGVRGEFFRRSTGTPIIREAQAIAAKLSMGYENTLEQCQSKPASLSQKQIESLVGQWYEEQLETLSENPGKAQQWLELWDAEFDEIQLNTPLEQVPAKLVERWTPEITKRLGLNIDWPSKVRLAERMQRARDIMLIKVLPRYAKGDWRPNDNDPSFPPLDEQALLSKLKDQQQTKPKKGELQDALQANFRAKPNMATDTVNKRTRSWEMFCDHIAPKTSLAAITRSDIISFLEKLRDGEKRVSTATIKKRYLSDIRAILNTNLIGPNPKVDPRALVNLKIADSDKGENSTDPFSDQQIKFLLTEARKETDPKKKWLIWLAAFTGARQGEIANLHKANVFMQANVHCIEFDEHFEGQSSKNKASKRIVPLHPALIDEGFYDWAMKHKERELFDWPKVNGTQTNKARQWFREEFKPAVAAKHPSLMLDHRRPGAAKDRFVFHSFRHTFERWMNEADMNPIHQLDMTGRSVMQTSKGHYHKGTAPGVLLSGIRRIRNPLGRN